MFICSKYSYGTYATIMIKFSMEQFTFDPSPHIMSPLEIHVYAYHLCFKNSDKMKFGMPLDPKFYYFDKIQHEYVSYECESFYLILLCSDHKCL